MSFLRRNKEKTFDVEGEEEMDLAPFRSAVRANAPKFAIFAIAVIMISFGLNSLYKTVFIIGDDWLDALNIIIKYFGDQESHPLTLSHLVYLPSGLLFVVCGALIILDRRKSFIRSVGFYALCMGFNRIIATTPYILSHVAVTSSIGWLMFAMGLNLMLSGIYMLSGTTRGRMGMLISSAGLMTIYLEFFALLLYIDHMHAIDTGVKNSLDLLSLILRYPTISISCFMYATMIWLLGTDQIRYSDKLSRHIGILKDIENTYRASDCISITEGKAAELMDPGSQGWKVLDDGGPAEREFDFVSESDLGSSYVTVQKWKGLDELYFTMTASGEGTRIFAERFAVSDMIPDNGRMADCGTITLLSREGRVIVMTVSHATPGGKL